jgi:hypothetical protein
MSKNEFDALLLKKLEEEAFEYNPDSWKQLSEKLNHALPVHEEITTFDALLIAKLNEDNFDYNPESWNRIADKLDNKAPEPVTVPFPWRKWGIAIGTAADLFVIGFAVIKFNDPGNVTETNNNPVIVKNTETKQPIPESTEKQIESQQALPVAKITPPSSMAHQPAQVNKSNILPSNVIANNQPNVLIPNNAPVIAAPVNKTEVIPIPDAAIIVKVQKNEVNTINKEITAPVKQESGAGYIAQNQLNQPWPATDYVTAAPVKPKTNISFGGGVNYGNINTGYTAGVSIKRKIGNDFFVDGTVAMMYNNNANNVAANNGPPINQPSNTAAKPSKGSPANSVSTPALDPVQKLYYVQMNPSFGYQIEDKVALSVGGDFQKMLNEKAEIIQPDNNNTKIFPTMDVGLTTKTEFIISPNLQAGFVYREGLNNLFKSDAPYVNRRYVQVQFKYNIPLK